MSTKSGKWGSRKPRKKRGPMKDISRNLAVRMTDEQYEMLKRYMDFTSLPVTVYFHHLITGYQIKARSLDFARPIYYEDNKIYQNLMQLQRNPRANQIGAEQLQMASFLWKKISHETYLLTSMESEP